MINRSHFQFLFLNQSYIVTTFPNPPSPLFRPCPEYKVTCTLTSHLLQKVNCLLLLAFFKNYVFFKKTKHLCLCPSLSLSYSELQAFPEWIRSLSLCFLENSKRNSLAAMMSTTNQSIYLSRHTIYILLQIYSFIIYHSKKSTRLLLYYSNTHFFKKKLLR